MIEIRLDGDPRGKGRHRHRLGVKAGPDGTKRPFVFSHPDPKTADYEARLAWAAQSVMAGRALLSGALQMTFLVFMPIPASWSAKKRKQAVKGLIFPTVKPDWDNAGKITDALNKVVWLDDAQIVTATVHKRYSDRPRVEISICEITPLDIVG